MTASCIPDSIVSRFVDIAQKNPHKIAVKWKHQGEWSQLTYSELLQQAKNTAQTLQHHGVSEGCSVVLPAVRQPQLCSHLLGILWCGANYVFIDPEYPLQRQVLIADSVSAKHGIKSSNDPALEDLSLTWIDVPFSSERPSASPAIPRQPDQPAYIMFTSGSTGFPKGVVVPHRAILRLVVDTAFISLSNRESFLQVSALGFDASTLEIWGPLLNGGTCVLHPEPRSITLDGIADVIASQKISTLWLTSSLFNTFVTENPEALKPVTQLLTGGEALSVPHVRKALAALPGTTLFNGYGPTENTTFSTTYKIPKTLPEATTRIPIGYAINGTECALIDEDLKIIHEPDASGELIVFGDGLALGYLNNPELTRERFIEVRMAGGALQTGYRTGDLVSRTRDGLYDYLGRLDKQVKIDGHRIEPGEIECHLNELSAVKEARVILRQGPHGQKRLAAYLVSETELNVQQIRAALKSRVPDFMIPHFMVQIPDLPKTRNGKLDESRLPDPYQTASSDESPMTAPDARQSVANGWFRILDRQVRDNENFMDAGGTSLEALKLAKELEQAFGLELSATFVFEYPTIAQQAQFFTSIPNSSQAGPNQTQPEAKHCEFAIVGIACRFPGADNLEEFWANLLAGKETVRFFSDAELSSEIPTEQIANPAYVKAKGIVDGFDQFDAAFFGISPLEARVMDPQQRLLLELSWHALEDAGIPPGDHSYRTGVFAGMNWARYYQQYVLPDKELVEGYGALNCGLANEPDLLSTRISYKLNLKGPSINVFTACSTGLVAVAQACEAIENGQCEQALAAGVSISTPIRRGYLYQEGSMLSKDGHCRPFDANATGTTFNDGAAVVVIKRRDLAERDGDDIYAVIRGYAVNNDGEQKASFTAPSVSGQVAVYEAALKRAGVQPSSIGFIETHGTATPLGDPIEVLSLKRCYHNAGTLAGMEKTCAIGSVKSNIGHAIHAAGLASLIKTAMAVKENKIPPTLFFKSPNPKLELEKSHFHVNTEVENWRLASPRRAAVTSLGVGGTNAHVILEEPTPNRPAQLPVSPAPDNEISRRFPILISAKSKPALERQIEEYRRYLNEKRIRLADASYTSVFGRKHFDHRFVAFGEDLEEAVSNLSSGNSSVKGKAAPGLQDNIGFMFSGQGTQARAMGFWLYSNSPSYRETFDRGCAIVRDTTGVDVKSVLLAEDSAESNEINQTSFVQPALFLLEYGLAQHLMALGVHPTFMIGHSIGEFAAAALAGIFRFDDAVKLVARRGALMQSMPPGNMLVVRASAEEVAPWIGQKAELAAVNAPDMIVLSGEIEVVSQLSQQLTQQKIANTLLATSHAFHSSMMDPIVPEFERLVSETQLAAPSIPIFSTLTGKQLTDAEAISPSYWSQQLRNPVRFSSAIQAASLSHEQTGGHISLVEIGPGNTLVSLVNFHKQPDAMRAYPALKNKGTDDSAIKDIDACVGQLWADGHSVDWGALFADLPVKKERLPGYAFAKDRYWLGPEAPETSETVQTDSSDIRPKSFSEIPVTQDVNMDANQHSERIRSVVLDIIEDVSGYDLAEDDPTTHFSEVGLDSLLLTQVATALERKFKLGITFRNLVEEYTSLALVADFIASKLPPEPSLQPITSGQAETTAQPSSSPTPMPEMSLATSTPTGDGSIQDIVNAQLQIMRLQLQALGGTTVGVPASAPAQMEPSKDTSASPAGNSSPAHQEATETPAPASNSSSHTPGTRISRERASSELTSAQRDWVDRLMAKYQDKYAGSKSYTQKHRKHLADPRSVSGFNPAWKEIIFPIVTVESKGSKLWDIDGNELIDTSNGFGPILFGHSPDFISNAAKAQIDRGIETGPQSPLAGEVAELFCEITGNERCTFACTGSEANVGALRIARTVTGRSKVVAFTGSYHGIHDEVVMRAGKDNTALPAAPGIPKEATSNMILLPWGEPSSLERIRELGDELAAVLVEPVQSRKPQFHSREYISEIRRITGENGVALILDEVVTGFRVGPGGIRKRFDIDADLVTYGKVIGGGYPIGIIAGKAKYLDAMDGGQWQFGDDSIPEQGVTFFAGTFVRHPLSLAVAKAVLNKIKTDGAELYPALEQKTSAMAQEAKAFIDQLKSDVSFEEFASLFYISAPQSAHWGHLLFLSMTLDGIHIQQYRPNFLTTAHSDEDIQRILAAFKSALANLIVHGLLVGDQVAAKKFLSGAIPPGAKLGKNEHGEPAYFIEDPNNKGAYMEVGRP